MDLQKKEHQFSLFAFVLGIVCLITLLIFPDPPLLVGWMIAGSSFGFGLGLLVGSNLTN